MKYVSIDIETTGLDPEKHEVVEIGAVIDDGGALEELAVFRCLIVEDDWKVTPYCMLLHSALWKEMGGLSEKIRDELKERGIAWLNGGYCYARRYNAMAAFDTWLDARGLDKITAAGKNFFGFDARFLRRIGNIDRIRHRALDPAMAYRENDLPSMATCCERAGIDFIDGHTAVGDCLTVIKLLRSI